MESRCIHCEMEHFFNTKKSIMENGNYILFKKIKLDYRLLSQFIMLIHSMIRLRFTTMVSGMGGGGFLLRSVRRRFLRLRLCFFSSSILRSKSYATKKARRYK